MEDQLIIKLFFQRSESAITKLSEKYGNLCKSLSYNILKNHQDAEECVNDAYLAAWNTIPPQEPKPLSAYICRITRNLSLKRYHANTAQKRNNYYDAVLEEFQDCLESTAAVEDVILVKELSQQVNSFLGTLKVKDRVIFIQRYWFCDSIPEIAKKLGVSANYVTVHLHRTREKLKKYLKKEGLLL